MGGSVINYSRLQSEVHSTRLPWLVFLFLLAIFFIAQHNLSFAVKYHDTFRADVDELRSAVTIGNPMRRIALLALGLFGLTNLLRRGPNKLRIDRVLGWLILFFLVWICLSMFWADDVELALRRLLVAIILWVGALSVAKRLTLRNIISLAFFSTIIYLLVGIVCEIGAARFQPFLREYRFAGTCHPNVQGLNCAVLFTVAISLAKDKSHWKYLYILSACLGMFFLILTKSRVAFGSALLGQAAYCSLVSSGSKKTFFILSLGWLFGTLLLFFGESLVSTIFQGILLHREDAGVSTLSGRVSLWKDCIQYISQRPFLGYGYGSFWTPRHLSAISSLEGWGIGTFHSSYLEMWISAGIIGLFTFLFIQIFGIKRSVEYYKSSGNLSCAAVFALLVLLSCDMILESVITTAGIANFLWITLSAKMGFFDTT